MARLAKMAESFYKVQAEGRKAEAQPVGGKGLGRGRARCAGGALGTE